MSIKNSLVGNLDSYENMNKIFKESKEKPEMMKTRQEHINELNTYVSIRDKIASVLGVKPVNVVIRFSNKIRTEPNHDPFLALSVLTPYLEQDTELLKKVERLVYQGIPKDQGFVLISCTKEIFDENHSTEGSPTFRKNRKN